MSNWRRIQFAAVLCLGTLALTTVLLAEVPPQSLESLRKNATHIVTGKVAKITETVTKSGNTADVKGVCEITVTACEKGEGIETGKVVKVRYEQSHWIGKSPSPPRSAGHRDIPELDDNVRVYLSKAKDGGYDVEFPNGFEQLKPEGK